LFAGKTDKPLVLINAPGPGNNFASRADRKQIFLNLFADNLGLQAKFKEAIRGSFDYDTMVDCIIKYDKFYLGNNQAVK
jgi:hypothetical protein